MHNVKYHFNHETDERSYDNLVKTYSENLELYLRKLALEVCRETVSKLKVSLKHKFNEYEYCHIHGDDNIDANMLHCGKCTLSQREVVIQRIGEVESKQIENVFEFSQDENDQPSLVEQYSTQTSAQTLRSSNESKSAEKGPGRRQFDQVQQFFVNIEAESVYFNLLEQNPNDSPNTSIEHGKSNLDHYYNLVIHRLEEVHEMESMVNQKMKGTLLHQRKLQIYTAFYCQDLDTNEKNVTETAPLIPINEKTTSTTAQIDTGTTLVNSSDFNGTTKNKHIKRRKVRAFLKRVHHHTHKRKIPSQSNCESDFEIPWTTTTANENIYKEPSFDPEHDQDQGRNLANDSILHAEIPHVSPLDTYFSYSIVVGGQRIQLQGNLALTFAMPILIDPSTSGHKELKNQSRIQLKVQQGKSGQRTAI